MKLFEMNAYGDIWQEPDLFDQPADPFTDADVIFAYTRRQAVEDGEQVDLSESDLAAEAGFRFPVFLTRRVWDTCVEVPANKPTQDLNGRLWDVLYMLQVAVKSSAAVRDRINYRIRVVTAQGARNMDLLAVCGPIDIDDPRPSITVMFPDED